MAPSASVRRPVRGASTHASTYRAAPDGRGSDSDGADADDADNAGGSPIRRLPYVVAIVLVFAGLLAARPVPTRAADPLRALPPSWPSDRLELGLADSPGGAAALRAPVPFKFRYQYLAGGVNTGNGWSTWNPNGAFVSDYIADSAAHGIRVGVRLLHAAPVVPGHRRRRDGEGHLEPRQPRDDGGLVRGPAALLPARRRRRSRSSSTSSPTCGATSSSAHRTTTPRRPGVRRELRRRTSLAGLRTTPPGFARAIVRLRDRYAPNVLLAYHLSVWGTGKDIAYSHPRREGRCAGRPRCVLLHVHRRVLRCRVHRLERPRRRRSSSSSTATAARPGGRRRLRPQRAVRRGLSSRRRSKRVVMWQIPLGNTRMRAMNNTWGHYQDNRVAVAAGRSGGTHLRDCPTPASSRSSSGVVRTARPAPATRRATASPTRPRSTATTPTSFNADDDGGFFRARAAAYYAAGGLDLGFGVPPPPPVTPPPPPPRP